MQFEYECEKCGELFEESFPIGKAEKNVPCPFCDGQGSRAYNSMSFQLKGGGWPGKAIRMKSEMTSRNERAGKRMRKEHGDGPMKLEALDYGNGDVREVKKK